MARGLRSLLVSIAVVIVWIWLRGGGVSGVHTAADLLTSIGRITGLFGAYALLLQVLLLARIPVLEWVAGFDRLTRWHRLNGKLCLGLILAHVATIVAGYTLTDRIALTAEIVLLLGGYPGMIAALIGTILLILVVVTSVVIVRRLRYETWFLVHLQAIPILQSDSVDIVSGATYTSESYLQSLQGALAEAHIS